MDEELALAECPIVVPIAERPAALERGQGHVALDGGELERECRHRPGEAGQRLRLETFDVDLDEGGHAVARDQRIERGHRHADAPGPSLALPAGGAVGGCNELRRGGRHRRIVDVELELDLAGTAADRKKRF